jgi:hypothetical protein
VASVLEQALKVSFNAWIRSLIFSVGNDCQQRGRDFFLKNCATIIDQQAYMPIADKDYLIGMCVKTEIKQVDGCETISKKLV